MLKYEDVRAFTQQALTDLGYGSQNPDISEPARTMPTLLPGPITSALLQKSAVQSAVFLQVGNGVGPTTELLFDKTFITVRVIGVQSNYEYAETLAGDLDDLFLSVDSPMLLGAQRVLYVTRTGGAPQLVDFDSANRHHFQCTYITEAQR